MDMLNINVSELAAIILYFIVVIGIGVYFFIKSKSNEGEKSYFLGGRNISGWVGALSAGASDMSAWVLMGLPGSIYLYGIGKVWIAVGLFIGTVLAWIFVAPRLRRYSIRANDSITIPQFLTNRFKTKNLALQIICAIVFVVVYCVYTASSIYACGTVFGKVFGTDAVREISMLVATVIIVFYTFLGGFNAVCWTDFFQGLLMLGALMLAPIIAMFAMNASDFVAPALEVGENYYNIFSNGKLDWASIKDILSGLGWGLGYFGMPHILIRYMSIKSEKEMKKSRIIGCIWTGIILVMACVVALVGRQLFGSSVADESTVFVAMVKLLFPGFIAGILLSAIIAASMSTADSQLLASSSAFSSDVYKPVFRKKASDKEMIWAGRFVVLIIAVVAFFIARSPECKGIMALVECAWGAFGAAFGPVILLALYWKRFTYGGAVAGIITGFAVDMLWYFFLPQIGIYEIIPGFICGLIVSVVVSLLGKMPSDEICSEFEEAKLPVETV